MLEIQKQAAECDARRGGLAFEHGQPRANGGGDPPRGDGGGSRPFRDPRGERASSTRNERRRRSALGATAGPRRERGRTFLLLGGDDRRVLQAELRGASSAPRACRISRG